MKTEEDIWLNYWLYTHGGRDLTDIKQDFHGMYVSMLGYSGLEDRIYIPRVDRLKEIYHERNLQYDHLKDENH